MVTVQWVYACVEKWLKADENLFQLTKESTPPVGRPLGSKYVNDLANMDTIGKAALADMNNEVDEALSDDEDDGDNEDEDDDGNDVGEDKGDENLEEKQEKNEEEMDDVEQNGSVENQSGDALENETDSTSRGQKRKHCPEMEDEEEVRNLKIIYSNNIYFRNQILIMRMTIPLCRTKHFCQIHAKKVELFQKTRMMQYLMLMMR